MAKRTKTSARDPLLKKVRRHIRILVDLGRLGGESADFQRFLDQAVVQVARAVEIDHVKILQYRPKTADLLIIAGVGWREGVVGSATLPSDLRSPPGRSFQTGQPVIISDFREQDEFYLSALLKQHGIIALANVPILIGGTAWGVLEVDSTERRDFSQDTVEFLMAAASLLGAIMERRMEAQAESIVSPVALEAFNRDTLLREMQHRVKNNFQIIMSSIAMQRRRSGEAEVHRVLDDLANRISAIALAHDQLAVRRSGNVVGLADYVRALCQLIEKQVDHVAIEVEADELELSIDRAVSLGLILNEITTNSIKHAFGAGGGSISVKLVGGIGYGEGRLTVSDNGRGMDSGRQGGSGLALIAALARQMGGSVAQESSSRGTVVALTFPMISS